MILVGPSGCGKSTALRMVAGLEDITGGELKIGGQVVNDKAPKDRDIAMVFQNYALYPHMTVRENMGFALKLAKTPQNEIDKKVGDAAKILDLEQHLDRKPANLSGGQRQRVAMGRAIVRDPSAFLMDEPLSNLDAKLRSYMRAELKALQQELGVTTIYVTHDQAEAMTMADQIAVMDHGRLQQIASPAQIYNRPANRLVAGFVGSPPMNFLDGELVSSEQRVWLQGSGFQVDLTDWLQQHMVPPATTAFTIGMRAEHITLGPVTDGAPLIGTVYVSEPLGAEVIVNLKVGDAVLKVRTAPEFIPPRGERFAMQLEPQHIHGFDAETGQRIPDRAHG